MVWSKSMNRIKMHRKMWSGLVFVILFTLSVAAGAAINPAEPANAAPPQSPLGQETVTFAGSASCAQCHVDIHTDWLITRHAQAFSSPIFQRDWSELSKQTSCLECHTTGFDPASGGYAEEGVSCEACHGAFDPRHPAQDMSIIPDADLCSTCHKTTTDEWRASPHNAAGIQCQACHNPHSQTPKAESVTALCTNCHKDMGSSFTHGTHANAGLECSNCHMFTLPRTDSPIGGLVPTGHTFTVGSETCIGCHQDTVHTRDEIIKLSGDIEEVEVTNIEDLKQTIVEQDQTIESLETSSNVRLYTGLVQGAIVGLVTGGAAAWVVSRRIEVVEVSEDE
jgi:predicted CXXCH cytochrome family protein